MLTKTNQRKLKLTIKSNHKTYAKDLLNVKHGCFFILTFRTYITYIILVNSSQALWSLEL